jgi:hypothetical protein
VCSNFAIAYFTTIFFYLRDGLTLQLARIFFVIGLIFLYPEPEPYSEYGSGSGDQK